MQFMNHVRTFPLERQRLANVRSELNDSIRCSFQPERSSFKYPHIPPFSINHLIGLLKGLCFRRKKRTQHSSAGIYGWITCIQAVKARWNKMIKWYNTTVSRSRRDENSANPLSPALQKPSLLFQNFSDSFLSRASLSKSSLKYTYLMSFIPTRSGLGSSSVRPPNMALLLRWVPYRSARWWCQYLQMMRKPMVPYKSTRLFFRSHLIVRHLSPSTGLLRGPTIFLSLTRFLFSLLGKTSCRF